jgi:hypothetical protein
MSYAIIDDNGKSTDIATISGLEDLERVAGPALRMFLEHGVAYEDLAAEIAYELKGNEALAYLRPAFAGSAPFILSNGVTEDEQ